MSFNTNTKPRVMIGAFSDRPTAPAFDALIYISEKGISGYSTTGGWLDADIIGTGTSNASPGSLPYDIVIPVTAAYTTNNTQWCIAVDTTNPLFQPAGAPSILLKNGNTTLDQIVMDIADNATANNIIVGVEGGGKLNGVAGGTVLIKDSGALRAFKRTSDGHWHGGV